jgi:chemotaxis response regulator CheB
MRLFLNGPGGASGARRAEPIRVMLIDPDTVSGTALGRAINLCPDLALVSLARDLRRAASEAVRSAPDVVAIRLPVDDERCEDLLGRLAGLGTSPIVVVLGAALDRDGEPVDSAILLDRLRAVAGMGRAGQRLN